MTQNSILLLDDEFLVLLDLQAELERIAPFKIFTARNIADALEIIERYPLDVAFLDINLGDGRSYPVANALRDRDIPFAFVSGYGRDNLDPAFDAVPLIAKPIGAEDVQNFVRQAFDLGHARSARHSAPAATVTQNGAQLARPTSQKDRMSAAGGGPKLSQRGR